MSGATEAQKDAAFDAYYTATRTWRLVPAGHYHIVRRVPEVISPTDSIDESETEWRFADEDTANRFLVVKILEAVADAVVAT